MGHYNNARQSMAADRTGRNIHYGDILTVFGDVLDVELEAIPRITGSSLLPKHDPFLLQNGDVVIADTAEDSSAGKAIELTGINDKEQVIGGQHTMPCRPYVKFSPYFLGYLLNSSCFRDALINQLQGIKVLSISKANLGALPVRFPVSSIEQQHIGALFKELDHNIELNRGLLEKLTQLKKSMLEQMFPREGESVPRLRFAGFTEPWKTDSFEQVFSFLPKVNIAREQLSVSSGCVKNIHYGDILTVFGDVLDVNLEAVPRIVGSSLLPKHDPFLLQNGDVVIADTAEDSSAGKVIELTGVSDGVQVIGGQHTMPCRPCVKFSPYFLGYLLNSSCFRDALVNQLQGIKVLSISKANLSVLSVKFPDSLAEQQRIGEFFKALDLTSGS